MMIFSGACWVVAVVLLPETFAPVLLLKKVCLSALLFRPNRTLIFRSQANRLRKADPVANKEIIAEHEQQDWTPMGVLHRTLLRPLHMLLMEPILVLVTVYLSVVYGLLYARASLP